MLIKIIGKISCRCSRSPNYPELVISRCCCVENGKEIYKEIYNARAEPLFYSPFVWWRSYCCCRRALLKLSIQLDRIDFSLLAPKFSSLPREEGVYLCKPYSFYHSKRVLYCKKENSLLILKHQVYFWRNDLPNGRNVYTEVTIEVNYFHVKDMCCLMLPREQLASPPKSTVGKASMVLVI